MSTEAMSPVPPPMPKNAANAAPNKAAQSVPATEYIAHVQNALPGATPYP